MQKEHCTKFCSVLIKFQEVMKLQRFEFSVNDVIPANVQVLPWFSLQFFVNFTERKPPIKFHGVFVHFSQTYEVAKF